MPQEAKFKIGDKVDFVNDYGVIFKDRIIKEIHYNFWENYYGNSKNVSEEQKNDIRYVFENDDTPWFPHKETNLHLAGTYQAPNLDIELNNGLIAKFSHTTYWGENVYIIETSNKSFNVVLLKGKIHSFHADFEEAGFLIKKEFQPKKNLNKNLDSVQCNKCMWQGREEDLLFIEDGENSFKACPNCKVDDYLADIPNCKDLQ